MKLNEQIKHHRKKVKLSQEQLASKAHTTKSTISKWESGALTPNVDSILVIAKALNTTFYELMGEKQPLSKMIVPWIGKIFLYAFIWIHIDFTVAGIAFAIGVALGICSILGGFAFTITIVVSNSMNNNWDFMHMMYFFMSICSWPILFLVFSTISYALLYIAKMIHGFSLKYFWDVKWKWFNDKYLNLDFKKVSRSLWVVILISIAISIIAVSVFYTVVAINGSINSLNIEFMHSNRL